MWKSFLVKLQAVGHKLLKNEFLHLFILRILLNLSNFLSYWENAEQIVVQVLLVVNKNLSKEKIAARTICYDIARSL